MPKSMFEAVGKIAPLLKALQHNVLRHGKTQLDFPF